MVKFVCDDIIEFFNDCFICYSCGLYYFDCFYIPDMCKVCSYEMIKPLKDDKCYICLDDFSSKALYCLPCNHILHRECFYNLKSDETSCKCGICRRELNLKLRECECDD